MKIIVTIILLAALAAGGYYLWQHPAGPAPANGSVARPTTALVEATNINFTVTLAGEIAPAEQVSVRPEINGKIATLNVDVGDKVKAGEVLFTLDDKELQNQKSASLADVERAQLQLEQAQRNFKRNAELFAASLVSLEAYDNSKTEVALASNALERAHRDLSVLDERLTKTVIQAPFDCTVLVRPVSVGQAVSGSAGVGGGTEVLVIADLNQMVINAHVNQADVTRLKLNQPVEVNIEAVAGLTVTGIIDRIAPQATLRNNIKGFPVRIALRNIDPQVQPGMTANISIPVASAANVLAVPLAAVFSEQGERYVFVQDGGQYERRPVQIGVADYFYAEIVTGLRGGEVVSLEQPPAAAIKAADPQSAPLAATNRSSMAVGQPPPRTAADAPKASVSTNRPAAAAPASTARSDT